MENGKRKMENSEDGSKRDQFSSVRFSSIVERNCPACGAAARRDTARFCLICGKLLTEDYQPLDAIRSSYHLQGQSFLIENAKSEEVTDLFRQNENTVSQMAWACFVYSLVPYLGILFVPFTFVISSFGYFTYLRNPKIGGRKFALVSFFLSFIVLAIQILLWWLLYIVPELGRQI